MSVEVIYLVAVVAFITGVVVTLAALKFIESRTLARPGARVAVATRLLDESAAASDAWQAWCAAHPGSPDEDDSHLNIHQWGTR